MRKHIAHYDLPAIKRVVAEHGINVFTRTAIRGAVLIGLSNDEAIAVVMSLTHAMLYKSMPTHADPNEWQDVYRAPCPNGKVAYIKLTLRPKGSVVIQFKEL